VGTNIVAIVSAFNEEDIIAQVVADLIRQRVSVYVLDDGSTDRTAAEVEPFLGRGVVGLERFSQADVAGAGRYEWQRILERKAQLAQDLDAEWFIHHDADEFREGPWADIDLATSIERVDRFGYNAIDFELLNFWPTHDNFKPGQDVREAFTRYEPGEPWNKTQVRCWKKTTSAVDLASTGGHEAIFPHRHIFPIRFILRHYPIRSQAHAERKVFEERRPRFIEEERQRGWHIQYTRFEPGHNFIRDAATLVPYDPDQVRLNLIVHHRGVEELEGRPEAEQRVSDQAKRYAARVEQELDKQNRQIERLEQELDARNHQTMALESELDVQNRRCQALDSELDARNRAFMTVERDLDTANHRLADLERKLDATRSSWVRRLRSRLTGR
jgi:Glycosyl transferase family 2